MDNSLLMSRIPPSDLNQEGYGYEFISSTEKYECPICLMCTRDPHLTECGHRFCNNCIRKWLRDEERGKKCPSCNELLSELQLYPDNFTKREILSFMVKCSFVCDGCPTVVELKKIEAHEASCDYAMIQCPQGCPACVPRKALQVHLNEECSRRNLPCPHCSLVLPADKLEGHVNECDLATADCQYCQLSLKRQQINRHIHTDCPKALVKCLFHRFGCDDLLPRTDISQHNVQQTQLHLRLLALTLDNLIRNCPDLQPLSLPDKEALSSWSAGEAAQPDDVEAAAGVLSSLRLHIPPPEQRLAAMQSLITPVSGKLDDGPAPSLSRRRFLAPALASSCSLQDDDDIIVAPPNSVQLGYRRPSTVTPAVATDDQSGVAAGGCSKNTAFCNGSDSDLKKEKCAGADGGQAMAELVLQSASEQHRIRELEKESATQRQYVFELKAKLAAAEKQLQTMHTQFSDMDGRMCGGTYVWRLSNFSKLRQNSAAVTAGVLHSPGFYTSFYGYKFCMRVNVNGLDTSQGTHLSLFIHLMQSEHDDLLTWPFQGKITLTILDQNEAGSRNHITETLVAKPTLTAFQRPTAVRNHKGFGYMEFAPFTYLESASYVKNDTLLIRAEVKPV